MGAQSLIVAAISGLILSAPSVDVDEAVRLYNSSSYADALIVLTRALPKTKRRQDLARIHVYIGLIQSQYDLLSDARVSFKLALDQDLRVQLPAGAPPLARRLFLTVKTEVEKLRKREAPRELARVQATDKEPNVVEAPRTEALETSQAAVPSTDKVAIVEPTVAPPEDAPSPILDTTPRVEPKTGSIASPASDRAEEGPGSATPIAHWVFLGIGALAAASGATFTTLALVNNGAASEELLARDAKERHDIAISQRSIAIVSFGLSGLAFGIDVLLLDSAR